MRGKIFFTILIFSLIYWNSKTFLNLLHHPASLTNVGFFICFSMAALGTAKGIISISNVVSGTAIILPGVWSRSTIGSLVCESNLIVAFVITVYLYSNIDYDNLPLAIGTFMISLIVGISCYISSVTAGLICSAVTIVDGKDRRVFSKVAIFELLAGSYGIFSLAIALFLIRGFQ